MAGTQQSLRKALGALKDSTTVGLAKVNSGYKELDVAIVKATNHLEVLSKEKHIHTIFNAVSSSRPRADVCYCINTLAKRLAKTHNWAVALKTLIVIHRALREVGPTFREELLNYSRGGGLMLNLSHFKDDSSPNAWDYSAWVRSYALYLEERLECFRILKYDVEMDRSILRQLDTPHLLAQLPALQQLLFRLLACQPEGAAGYNILIQYALSMVAAESLLFYVAVTDGTLNLVDKYFEMQRHDAVRALEIYRKAGNQAERLSQFLEICRGLDFGRTEKFIKIEQPPASFLEAMEEYVKEAPRIFSIEWKEGIGDSTTIPAENPEPVAVLEINIEQDVDVEEKMDSPVTSPEPLKNEQNEPAVTEKVADLLGLDYLDQEASKLDDKNALALAIFTSENPPNLANDLNLTSETNGWEVALVASTSSNVAVVAESKLGGGLDKLTLDSLYDDAIARRTNPYGTTYHQQAASNPFEATPCSQDPFYASSNITPPTNVQMASMNQQQALMHQQQQQQQTPCNPFGNPGETVQSYPNHDTYPGLI